ncbi:hypothetical protein KSW79_12090 [Prevotella copri]|uniref:hypothetical protein n=1 Tax=Segatella copri TaxID=165179 RepID=UPI001C385ED1|nr:hypothetical protein [Segatella copri]MBV3415126.1 hypothetical protein [Segatella copri]
MKKKQLHKPKWLVTMLLLVMAILMPYGGAWAQTKPTVGDGSVDNPYKISTAAELAWFRDYVNNGSQFASATLTADIDLSEFCHAADAATNTEELSWDPIGNGKMYCGTFDGNGKTIRNLYINSTFIYRGFFGYANSGSIKNITFDNAKVKNTNKFGTGILTGGFEKCTIENIKILANCSVEGTENTGGIAGAGAGYISNCENRAMVNGTNNVGGIVGYGEGSLQNSANYGDISGVAQVGNLIGFAAAVNLNNVLGVGKVTATDQKGGLLVGESNNPWSTASGILAYNSNAKLTINGTEQTGEAVKAIGEGSLTSAFRVKAFTAEQLKSGLVAFLLQENASESAKWGQKLNTDDYPLLSTANKVYSDRPVTLKCSGELEGTGTFTNTKPAQEGTFTMQHGNSIIHHESVDVTCTVDGTIEYWECNLCNETYLDEKLTQPVSNIIKEAATGHNYDENDKCTKCQKEIQFVKLGNNNITIEKVFGSRTRISGYNLYKFTVPEDGTLEVTADSHGEDTYGALWDSRTAKYLIKKDSGNGDGDDFKITYEVTKGTTYYIGAREYNGDAIEGKVTLNVKIIGNQPPAGVTGNGTEAEPFILKTADHLAWFRDYVNTGKTSACAKIADDVEEIDMSSVCHKADAEKQVAELSWTPIGSKKYQGTFDGNGKTIRNLFISSTSNEIGFFGCAADCRIKNITFDNAKVKGNDNCSTGILAGYAGSCVIENIKTTGNCSVEGQYETGGIAGRANGNISNCENHAIVNGLHSVGGIVGICFDSENSITSCANYGAITGTDQFVGGIIGYFGEGSLQNSANYGNITGDTRVGNLIGYANICNINNVLGIGNITANHANCNGLIVGADASSSASGILAYNSSAKMTIGGTELTGDAVVAIGSGSLTYPEGKNEADVVKAFTPEQLKSGEVAYLLNGSKSEGELAWYQKLGSDAYPVVKAAKGNTVYHGSFRYCDNTAASYSNSTSEDVLVHQMSATLASPKHDADEHIYHMGCRNEGCTLHKYVADKAGNIEVTKEANSKFVATEDLTLADGEDFKDYEAFTSKTISYSRNIPEGAAWGTLCVPFAIDLSQEAGCDFYRLTGIDADKECITIESYAEGIIPAGTPVLFKMKEGETVLSLSAVGADIATTPLSGTRTDVNLVGSFTQISGENLATSDYVIGEDQFCRVSDLHAAAILPMRAYLHPSDASLTSAAKLSIGKNDGSTAIDHLNAISRDADAEYYDASGRRTHGLQKGLNIVKRGGKTYKIMVK